MSRRGVAATAALAAGAGVAARALLEPRTLRTRDEHLALEGWPAELANLRIALVSDLHAGAPWMRERGVDRVVDAVRDAAPDLVALLGDYVDFAVRGARHVAHASVARRLAALDPPLGTYAVLGNHDWAHGAGRMRRALEEAGIPVVDDAAVAVHERLWVVGLGDEERSPSDAYRVFADVPDGPAVLCLAHDPDVFPRVPPRATLTVSGHTHGGQLRVPRLRARAIPSRYGERYAEGHVVEGGRHLYVSRGIGTSTLPVRLGVPPEVVVLHLTRGC